jgi:hypothetical protein
MEIPGQLSVKINRQRSCQPGRGGECFHGIWRYQWLDGKIRPETRFDLTINSADFRQDFLLGCG